MSFDMYGPAVSARHLRAGSPPEQRSRTTLRDFIECAHAETCDNPSLDEDTVVLEAVVEWLESNPIGQGFGSWDEVLDRLVVKAKL